MLNEYIKEYGCIWTKALMDIILDSSNEILDLLLFNLPDDKNFFQTVETCTLKNIIMPNGDYSKYNFKFIELFEVTFPETSKIPKSFFEDIDPSSCLITVPAQDYSDFSINKKSFKTIYYPKGSILPKDRDLFKQNSFNVSISGKLPKINLNEYNLDGVEFSHIEFDEDTIFPNYVDFFQKQTYRVFIIGL